MEKSINDIDAQLHRVIMMAEKMGKYKDNAAGVVDTQYLAQVARRTKVQHGFDFFCEDKLTKRPTSPHAEFYRKEPMPVKERPRVESVKATPKKETKGVPYDEFMSKIENCRKLNDLTRRQFLLRIYAHVEFDMVMCKMEGWDMFEYPRMIRDAVSSFLPKEPRQLKLDFEGGRL